jgi:hypothetical protein
MPRSTWSSTYAATRTVGAILMYADVATLAHQLPVDHLLPSGQREPHHVWLPALGYVPDRSIVWDGPGDS